MRWLLLTLVALLLPPGGSTLAHEALFAPGQGTGPIPTLAPVLERVTPAVVNIATVGQPVQRNPLFDDPFFRRFYNLPEVPEEREPQALGSGVIVNAEDGLIVTNSHVIENAARIVVILSDGRELDAELVGDDPQADIAALRVAATGLSDIAWADSATLRVGDFCVAIGNPFGLGQTVTSGIVSALGRSGLGRSGLGIEDFEDFIQTDASINPGNSGGALIGLDGKLIGINTAIVGPAGGNVGIGFAIPANLARDLVEQLVEFGEVRRGALGVAAQALTPDIAEAFGIDDTRGVLITRIRPGSPADLAGLQRGDIVTAIDGVAVRNMDGLRNRIGLVRIGQRLRLSVVRDARTIEIEATVAELQIANPLLEGVQFADREARNGRSYVQIKEVVPASSFAVAGLRADDIVLSVNRQRVASVDELEALAENLEGDLLLLIQRGRSTSYVRVPRS